MSFRFLQVLPAPFAMAAAVSIASAQTWLQSSAPSDGWSAVAGSADGTRLLAAAGGNTGTAGSGLVYISTNSGSFWTATSVPTNAWLSAASSADGSVLV